MGEGLQGSSSTAAKQDSKQSSDANGTKKSTETSEAEASLEADVAAAEQAATDAEVVDDIETYVNGLGITYWQQRLACRVHIGYRK